MAPNFCTEEAWGLEAASPPFSPPPSLKRESEDSAHMKLYEGLGWLPAKHHPLGPILSLRGFSPVCLALFAFPLAAF